MTWDANPATVDDDKDVELLDSADSDSVRFRDGGGNPMARVPARYDDDAARLFTFRFRRGPASSYTRFFLTCRGAGQREDLPYGTAALDIGQLWGHDVPLPPSSP